MENMFKGKILEVFIKNHKTIGQDDRLKAAKAAAAAEQAITGVVIGHCILWRFMEIPCRSHDMEIS